MGPSDSVIRTDSCRMTDKVKARRMLFTYRILVPYNTRPRHSLASPLGLGAAAAADSHACIGLPLSRPRLESCRRHLCLLDHKALQLISDDLLSLTN